MLHGVWCWLRSHGPPRSRNWLHPAALPATWGSLLSFEASNVSLAPQATTATSRTSVAAAPGASSSRLSAGAIAGIAIGAVAFVLILLGVVVWRGLQMNKARDADKSAQLAYMNEMTEADLEGEEEEEEEAAAKVREDTAHGRWAPPRMFTHAAAQGESIHPPTLAAFVPAISSLHYKRAPRRRTSSLPSLGRPSCRRLSAPPPPAAVQGEERPSPSDVDALPPSAGGVLESSSPTRITPSPRPSSGFDLSPAPFPNFPPGPRLTWP